MNTQHTDPADRPDQTVPGIGPDHAAQACTILQDRLVSLIDLHLTLKHVHWNVTGAGFIGVHEMLDGFTATARTITDEVAERIRTLGGVPKGRPGDVVEMRSWDDYGLNLDTIDEHLRELDRCYEGLLLDNRRAIVHVAHCDPVTEDMLLGHTAALEKDQWFIRSFLYDRQGQPTNRPRHDEHDPIAGDGERRSRRSSDTLDRMDEIAEEAREMSTHGGRDVH